MPITNCSDTADEILPLFSLGQELVNLKLTEVEAHFMFSDEVEIDPLGERDGAAGETTAADREEGKEVETTTTSNQWWPDPVPTYPASSTTYVAIICPYCGHSHRVEQCPRVEEIEYYRNGAIRRVMLRPILAEVRATVSVSWPTPPANDSGVPE